MTTPYIPGAQDQYPALGDWVTVEGKVSSTYLERGQRMTVRWSTRWEALHEAGYVRLVDEGQIPDADARFPTVQAVLDMIAAGAQTQPGEKILDVWATAVGISVEVGISDEFSRTFTVEWPAMDALVDSMQQLHDGTEALATDADAALAAGVQDLRTELVLLNGIASAAAQIALDAAGAGSMARGATVGTADVPDVMAAMQQRPALFSGAGDPPASIPGAVVGDWWLDESSMKLYRVTGSVDMAITARLVGQLGGGEA